MKTRYDGMQRAWHLLEAEARGMAAWMSATRF
jgi:hypothetical protein